QRVCDILGYSRDELLAKDFRELTHPDDLQANLEQVERLLRGEVRTFSLEKRYLRRDGTPVWVNLTASLVRGPQGEPRYSISVLEDVDTHRRAEDEVRRLNQELEQRVQERTAQALAVIQDLKQQIQA